MDNIFFVKQTKEIVKLRLIADKAIVDIRHDLLSDNDYVVLVLKLRNRRGKYIVVGREILNKVSQLSSRIDDLDTTYDITAITETWQNSAKRH